MDFKHLIFGALLLSLTQMGVEIPIPAQAFSWQQLGELNYDDRCYE